METLLRVLSRLRPTGGRWDEDKTEVKAVSAELLACHGGGEGTFILRENLIQAFMGFSPPLICHQELCPGMREMSA